MDPFREQNTLILTCDVLEPDTGKGYARDPRSLARRAENYLKSTGIGDKAFFGPEPEFFIFDGVTFANEPQNTFFKIFSEEGPWASKIEYEAVTLATALRLRAVTSRFRRLIRSPTFAPKW